MSILQLAFLLLHATCCFHLISANTFLIRTKRKPPTEYDYITDSLSIKPQDAGTVRTQRHTLKEINEPAEDVFKHLIDKSKGAEKEKVIKRQAGEEPQDPFVKLKAFFDELSKRSVDDADTNDADEKIPSNTETRNSEIIKPELPKNDKSNFKNEDVSKKQELTSIQSKASHSKGISSIEDDTNDVDDLNNSGDTGDASGSASGESDNGSGSGKSEDGSGSGSANFEEDVSIEKRSDDYEELFKSAKIPHKGERKKGENERRKRDLTDDDGNPDFEGIPETLAVIEHENPRVKILKREAKHIPDIPLPFNTIENQDETEKKHDEVSQTKKRRSVTSQAQSKAVMRQDVPYQEIKSLDVLKRSLGEEKFKNLKIIDDEKAKSLFDSEEGDFLKQVKKDGIYYDTRNKRFLISANAETLTTGSNKDHRTANKTFKRSIEAGSKIPTKTQRKAKRDIHEETEVGQNKQNVATDKKRHEISPSKNSTEAMSKQFQNTSTNGAASESTVAKSHVTNPTNDSNSKSKEVTKRDVHNSGFEPNNRTSWITKRSIFSDDDPNIDYLMQYTGKIDELKLMELAKIKSKKQIENMKRAEKVYRFARNVMDLVGDVKTKKQKRNIEDNPLTGVWSGLGTAPEFVPGLIKREQVPKKRRRSSSKRLNKHKHDHIGKNQNTARHQDVAIRSRPNHGKRDSKPGFETIALQKRDASTETDEEEDGGKPVDPEEELPLLSKRDTIPTEDDDENDQLDGESKENSSVGTDTVKLKKRDIIEQSESKHMELGSLGSINTAQLNPNMILSKSTILWKPTGPKQLKDSPKIVSKREDLEVDREMPHLRSTPVQDGKVVLAFDEVKELLPTRHFYSKDEEKLLEPNMAVQSTDVAKAYENNFDEDRDLAESMVLSGDSKRSNVYGLQASNVIYENNTSGIEGGDSEGRSKTPSLLKKEKKLKHTQMAQIKSDEITPKEEQMKNWVKNNKETQEQMDTEKKIEEVNDELAESTAELEKLRMLNKAEDESAYLAKKLEEKTNSAEDSSQFREEKFKNLQEKIMQEQAMYRQLLQEQREQMKQKAIKEGKYLGNKTQGSLGDVQGIENQSAINNHTDSSQLEFEAVVKAPEEQPISFGAADVDASSINANDHFQRAHSPVYSNETFSDETGPETWPSQSTESNVSISSPLVTGIETTRTPETTIAGMIQNTIATTQTLNNSRVTQGYSTNTTKLPTQVNTTQPTQPPTFTTTTAITLTTTAHVSNSTDVALKSTTTPVTTTKLTPTSTAATTATTTSTSAASSTTKTSAPLPVGTTESASLQNSTQNGLPNSRVKISNTTANSLAQTLATVATTRPPTVALVSPSAKVPVISKEAEKYPFPMEIAYRPKFVTNTTKKKKLEIEARADGYIGCFIDHLVQGRDLPVRAGVPSATPLHCRIACKKTGYKYAGLQYGYLCFCGNNYGKYDIVPDSECNTVCSGNDSFTCGGLWRNEIFDTEHVTGTYDEKIPYYTPPKDRTSMTELTGEVKSSIPSPGSTGLDYEHVMHTDEELLDSVHHSEFNDMKSLEKMQNDAVSRSTVGNVIRNVGNLTDQDLIKAAALELQLNQATQKDLSKVNHSPDFDPVLNEEAPTTDEINSPKGTNQSATFTYFHPQKVNDDKTLQSPVLPLKLEPGTHLFRGELMLQQPWYDDLSKPESTKYKILAANTEKALKNIFMNDSAFLKAETMSLRENGAYNPHKTIADFTLTFLQNETTDAVTHKLFDSVMGTKKLDEMPVIPQTLKVKEYLRDNNAQAFIPTLLDGNVRIDSRAPITLQYNNDNKLMTSTTKPKIPMPQYPLSSIQTQQAAVNAPQAPNSLENTAPLNPVVKPHIRPVTSDGIKELHNYMSDQSSVAETQGTNKFARPLAENTAASLVNNKKRKVPYVLRMFFWKDMLARKRRESNLDELQKYKVEAKKQKSIRFTNELPMIRARRSQADEWPTSYKKDEQKRANNNNKSFLKRRKRVVDVNEIETDKNENEYESLFEPNKLNSSFSRDKRLVENRSKKELVSLTMLKSDERMLSRKKRYDNSEDEKNT